jgi:hypothetical protein
MLSKGMAYARIPSQVAQGFLGGIGDKLAVEPQGKSMVRDLAMNIPSVAMKTLSKTVPTSFTPENLATMGAIEGAGAVLPKLAPFAKGLAGQLESAAGSPKGTLEHGFESAKNIFGPGKSQAGPLYKEAGQVKGGLLGGMYKPEEIVDTVNAALKKGDPIHPSEALRYRKMIDVLSKSGRYDKDALFDMRRTADEVVKQSQKYAEADPKFKTGMMNEALRGVLPKNKYGTTSAFKTGIMAAVPGAGAALSPIVQGVGATAAGAGTRGLQQLAKNPEIMPILLNILKQLRGQSATPQTGSAQ